MTDFQICISVPLRKNAGNVTLSGIGRELRNNYSMMKTISR